MKKQNKMIRTIWFLACIFPLIYVVCCAIASSGNTSLDIQQWWEYVSTNFALINNVPLFTSYKSIFEMLLGNVSISSISNNVFISIMCYYSFYLIIMVLIGLLIDIIIFIPKLLINLIERWVA